MTTDRPGGRRPYEPVFRRRDWTFPPLPVPDREVVSAEPDRPVPGRPPLLFVHGAAMGAWAWERWLPMAADAGWSAHAVSLRGHGASPAPSPLARTPLRAYEHDILQVITQLPAPPILIGHSMGGLLVQHVLERYREAPAGVLVCPAPPGHGLEILAALLRHDPGALAAGLLGHQPRPSVRALFGTPPPEAEAIRQRMGAESTLAAMQLLWPHRTRDVRTPLLVLGGSEDRVVPPHAVTRAARAHGTRAHLFRGMGHLLMCEPQAAAPLRFILDWLERTVGPSTR